MNRVQTFLALSLVFLVPLAAEPPAPASVFLDTSPLGSRIVLDGTLLAESTPALLRGLAPGPHRVQFWKEGRSTVDRTFTVAEGTVPEVTADLPPFGVVLAFPEGPLLSDTKGNLETPGRQFSFPPGTYSLSYLGETLRVEPVFPDEGLLALAGWSLAIVSGAALVSTGSDIWHIKTGWTDHPSTVTISLWVSALFEVPWYLQVQGRKDRFLRETAPRIAAGSVPLDRAPVLFARAEDALESGNLDEAAGLFSQVVRDYPDSRLVPGAWFRLARVHAVTGRRDLALGEYRLVAETYPQAATYDRALKALADLQEAAGNPTGALESLDKMVLTDGFFDQADIEAQKIRLMVAQEAPVAP